MTTLQDYYKEIKNIETPKSGVTAKGERRIELIQAKILGYKQARQEEADFLQSIKAKVIMNAYLRVEDRIKQIEELSGGIK